MMGHISIFGPDLWLICSDWASLQNRYKLAGAWRLRDKNNRSSESPNPGYQNAISTAATQRIRYSL